jgi:hypothetical protein
MGLTASRLAGMAGIVILILYRLEELVSYFYPYISLINPKLFICKFNLFPIIYSLSPTRAPGMAGLRVCWALRFQRGSLTSRYKRNAKSNAMTYLEKFDPT